MKQLILIFLIFTTAISAQKRKHYLFGSNAAPVALDTLTQAADTSASRSIVFIKQREGAATLYGHVKSLSGTDTTVTIFVRLINDEPDGDKSPWYSVGTITTNGTGVSVKYHIALPRQSWWSICDGLEVKYGMIDTVSREIEIRGAVKVN